MKRKQLVDIIAQIKNLKWIIKKSFISSKNTEEILTKTNP